MKYSPIAMLVLAVVLVSATQAADSDSKADLVGTIRDSGKQPIPNARVSIYNSFAPFGRGDRVVNAPSPDLSKTARTDDSGTFRIKGLDTNAMFQVVFTADGFRPLFYWRVKPSEPQEVTLRPAPGGLDPDSQVRGRVTDEEGKPIEGALIQVCGAHRQNEWRSSSWDDIESIAFTDGRGAFVIRGEAPFISVDLTVEARGFAKSGRQEEVRTGAAIHNFQLVRGGSIKGRVLQKGQPVAKAGVGITGIKGDAYNRNFAIMTDAEGRFHFQKIPPGRAYYLFGIMESLQERGSLPVRRVQVDTGVSETNVGDLELEPAFVLSGMVRFDDGTPAQPNYLFTLYRTVIDGDVEENLDEWMTILSKEKGGRFQFTGVPAEPVSLFIKGPPFYHLSPRNLSGDPARYRLLGRMTGNKTNLVFEIVRGQQQRDDVTPRNPHPLLEQPIRGAE